jgi:hypothetical protein
MAYWCSFQNRPSACVVAPNGEKASEIAEELTGELPTTIQSLPCASSPVLNNPPGAQYWAPCFQPSTCAGKTNCPRNPVCTD